MYIYNLIKDIKEFKDLVKSGTLTSGQSKKSLSISRRSQNAICYFPVLASRSLSFEEITMINKVLERQYSTFMRIAMGLDDVIDKDETKLDYIFKFHNNDIDFRNDSIQSLTQLSLDKLNESTDHMIEFDIKPTKSYSKLSEDCLSPVGCILENENKFKNNFASQLLDNDVKKANEVLPTTLDIEVWDKNSNASRHILLGVKTVTHPVSSEEIIFNLASAIKEKRLFFRTVQFTTGEIKFFKDFVLSLDRIKENINNSRHKINWFKHNRDKVLMSKLKTAIGKEGLIPNTSLVISMSEVDELNNIHNIDLISNVKSVEKFMTQHSLLSFVILDSSAEIAYIKFDGEANYHTFSYNALERENKNTNADMKSLVSLLTR